ncbi:MAG TPA: MarR family transcriptional regulator [Polyangia bacterium]|nr:MarR family transcriptional regulator [Polyangia bacterium]
MSGPDQDVRRPGDDAIGLVADTMGDLFSRFGLRPALGRVWAVLYLTPTPLDARGLLERLDISTGSLSMALGDLVELGLIERFSPPGAGRSFHRPVTETWTLINRIFRGRERPRLALIQERLERAAELLAERAYRTKDDETRHALDRVNHLVRVGGFVIDLLDAFMERTRVEIKAAQKWLDISGKLGGEPLSRLRRRLNRPRREE